MKTLELVLLLPALLKSVSLFLHFTFENVAAASGGNENAAQRWPPVVVIESDVALPHSPANSPRADAQATGANENVRTSVAAAGTPQIVVAPLPPYFASENVVIGI